jgi:ferredoxin-NADP reductase
VFSRVAPPDATRPPGRLAMADITPLLRAEETVYVCGSPAFAEAASDLLVDSGVPVNRIKVERFGPSG